MPRQTSTQLGLWPDPTFVGNRARHFRRPPQPEYAVYMETQQWRCQRNEAIVRQQFKCFDCGCEERLQAHHTTYAHLGDEWPEDIEALCDRCHARRHGK